MINEMPSPSPSPHSALMNPVCTIDFQLMHDPLSLIGSFLSGAYHDNRSAASLMVRREHGIGRKGREYWLPNKAQPHFLVSSEEGGKEG